MKTYKKLIAVFAILIALGFTSPAIATTYYEHTAITAPDINSHSDNDTVFAGGEYTVTCTPSTDTDKYYYCGWKYVSDNIIHTWSGAGTFDPGTGTSTSWTAPSTTGDVNITVCADDTGSPNYYDSPSVSDTVTLTVTNIIYVDKDATGKNDGSSWTDAFVYLQDALTAADNANVNENEIWVAEGIYTLTSTINVDYATSIYGGFDGTETSRSQRNWETNATIVDGDNSVRCFYVTANATIDGFTVTKGRDSSGAGIMCSSASPTIRNCTICNNTAPGSGNGGGMRNYQSSPTITNCTFTGNNTQASGGAIFNSTSSYPDIINCMFSGNSAEDHGGAICNFSGGHPTVINCVFTGNSADGTYGDGGGMRSLSGGSPTVTNCTFYNNAAVRNGGGLIVYSATVNNSIFWANTDTDGTNDGQSAQIQGVSGSSLNYNCIQDWDGSLGGTGNIGENPNFIDGLHLGNSSLCIDAGDNTEISEPFDIAGNVRKVEDPGQYNYGNGTPPIVDMGAYERTTATVLDYNTIAAGNFHTMAVEYNNRLWGCGSNNGYIGDDTYTDRMTLVPTHDGDMDTLSGYLENIIEVDAGTNFTLAVDSSGNVWSTGRNGYGQLGNPGAGVGVYTPVQVEDGEQTPGTSDYLENIVMVSASKGNGEYSLAIDSSDEVWAWGHDLYGVLGNGGVGGPTWPEEETPIQVHAGEQNPSNPDYPLQDIIDIEAGSYHTIACDSSGYVWTWGKNDNGQLGNGEEGYDLYENKPVQVLDGEQTPGTSDYLENIVDVASTQSATSFAVDSAGHVWGWGSGGNNKLAGGYSSTTPIQIQDGDQTPGTSNYLENIIAVSAGQSHILALEDNGNVWAWGYSGNGALGIGSGKTGASYPKQVKNSDGTGYLTNIVYIDAGFSHSIAKDSSGNIWVWGSNYYWQLGLDNNKQDEFTPQLVTLR